MKSVGDVKLNREVLPAVRGIVGALLHPAAVRATQDHETALDHGRCVGLTEEQAGEVIGVWRDYYATQPVRVQWRTIREAMTRRALGEEWRP